MTPAQLEAYLHEHIPITRAMGVTVVRCDAEEMRLRAPLGPNLNHRNTAFGGSIATLATLAAWSWLSVRTEGVRLVVRSSAIEYLAPIEADFEAVCVGPESAAFPRYKEGLRRHGKGRIELDASVECNGIVAATFVGTFVAIRDER